MAWWEPHVHTDRAPLLRLRGRIKAGLRGFFEGQGFVEVECGALAASPGNEAHLHAFQTSLTRPDGTHTPLYLHTSPEFAAKKLLAAGETRIFEFARVFRNRERTPLHAPEFTMLEWYRAHEDVEAVMADAVALLRLAARIAGTATLRYRDRDCDPFAEPERLSVADAFRIHAGIEILDTLSADGANDRNTLATRARRGGLVVTEQDNWSDIFSKVLAARVEPRLGLERPTLLTDYPRVEAALARPKQSDPRLSERFELYACGVELANGFGELTDATEQRARFAAEMDEKERLYGTRYPLDEDFLAALAKMPPASGVALGFDRLVMLATGAPAIDSVIWTPLALTPHGRAMHNNWGWQNPAGAARSRRHDRYPRPPSARKKARPDHDLRGAVRNQLLPFAQRHDAGAAAGDLSHPEDRLPPEFHADWPHHTGLSAHRLAAAARGRLLR